jgi:hypothetical protein
MITRPEIMFTSLLFVALVWALISATAFTVSLNYGMRRLAWFWAASLVSTLVTTYSLWRLV